MKRQPRDADPVGLEPHHDGSERYVSDLAPELGDTVAVFLHVPHGRATGGQVWVRSTPDAEPSYIEARVDHTDASGTVWRADLELRNPVVNYRFLLYGNGDANYRWLNGTGTHPYDVPDANDFRIATYDPPPAWAREQVLYQIFLDRFARSDRRRDWPEWARPAAWHDPIERDPQASMHQLYGGDLAGIAQRLDHLESLGVTGIYLTPFFPAESNHRYNASTFSGVDPTLGGDAALSQLSKAVHARGMRILGDLTLNHSGDTHDWFTAARQDPTSEEASFYHFLAHPDDYVSWLDVPTLPKFDHRSAELARRLYDGPDSVVAHWLRDPYALDGWRIDVANMTARYRGVDVNRAVARAARRTAGHVRPDSLLIAEHCHDASADLSGDGWHGTMAYAAFTRPVWSWLARDGIDLDFLGMPVPVPRFGGDAVAQTMRNFAASMPWRSYAHSLTLLGSHDTSRFRSVTGSREHQLVGAGLLLTLPGLPCIFAGDEIGLEGDDNETARRPMPWDRSAWDLETLSRYRDLVALRRHSAALTRGGLRWIDASQDSLTYLRQSKDEQILVHASRGPHHPVRIPTTALGLTHPREAEPLLDSAALDGDSQTVVLPADGPGVSLWRLPGR